MLNYLVYQALENLKWQIEDYEKQVKKEKSSYRRKQLEDILEWLFERGLNMIQYSKPGEVEPWLIDYFMNRYNSKPNIPINQQRKKDKTLPPSQRTLQAPPSS